MSASATTVRIARLETTFVVPRDYPAVHELRARGEEVVQRHLRTALTETLRRILPRDSTAVWIIRELNVDFAFAAERPDPSLFAAVWAREIAQSLTRTLTRGDGVIRFPNRAAFIAQFVADAAAGRDAGCWYYTDFESLAALPASARIREAIVREPGNAADVIFELARSHWLDQVVRTISSSTAQAIYEVAFPAGEIAPASPRLVETLLALADELLPRNGPLDTPQNRIRLLVAAHERYGQNVGLGDFRNHVDNLLGFGARLGSTDEPWRFVEALLDGDERLAVEISARHERTDLESLAWLNRLAVTRPDVLTCAASTFVPASRPAAARGQATASAFAGLALLLPSLADSGLFAENTAAAAALRTMVALKCAGNVRPAALLGDPIAILFSGTDHRVDDELLRALKPEDVDAMLPRATMTDADRQYFHSTIDLDPVIDEVTTSAAYAVMASFASHLFGFGGSSAAYVYENFLHGAGAIHETTGAPIIVDIPPVPLEMVLRMAGFHERAFTVPWLEDVPITLRLGAIA